MISLKSPSELAAMRASGFIAARVRDGVAGLVAPGITTAELADYAVVLMQKHGAESAFHGYRGYPAAICVSVNDCVVHGIPGARRINIGDIVSLDIGVRFEGFIGDTATTVMVGVADPAVVQLVETTERALKAGIAAIHADGRLSDISHAIEKTAVEAGLSVVREFVGHGIGRKMHEDPQVPNFGAPGRGPKLKPGMTLAIEPMVNLGSPDVEVAADGWTVQTKDRSFSAHFEHTIAITTEGAEILTL